MADCRAAMTMAAAGRAVNAAGGRSPTPPPADGRMPYIVLTGMRRWLVGRPWVVVAFYPS